MAYTNSPLVSYTRLSPNCTYGRQHGIDTITPHYMAGNASVETCAAIFAPTSRRASSNYGVGSDGRVGLYCEEKNRSWCSSSGTNDHRAVTIECANLADGSLTDAAWATLVKLCADICRRNGKTELVYTGYASWSSLKGNQMLLTKHCWFASTDCPGPWLTLQFDRLAREVNALLGGADGAVATSAAVSAPPNNRDGGKLTVDGYGGYNTILDLQHALGTYEDGEISGQCRSLHCYFSGMTNVTWAQTGSAMVRALQRKAGAGADGIWGRETSTRLQELLVSMGHDIEVDGYFGRKSVKALQTSLNAGEW